MRAANPRTRIFQIDPIINVVPRSSRPQGVADAENCRQSQSWDMMLGRVQPELGGREDLIDAVGVNYYIHNQFVWQGQMIVPSDPRYRHVSAMLQELYARYRRPLFIAETGIEDETRPWLRYICKEVFTAWAQGVPMDEQGRREVFEPLAQELMRQAANVEALRSGAATVADLEQLDTSALDWAAHVMQERTDESRAVSEPAE